MAEHFLGKVALKAVIEREGKVLIVRDIHDADIWELPGGRLDEGETPEEGLRREMREELGVEVTINELVYTEQSLHTKKGEWTLFLIFSASLADEAQLFVLAADEIAEMKWISKDELAAQKMYDVYRKGTEAYFNTSAA